VALNKDANNFVFACRVRFRPQLSHAFSLRPDVEL
jgi:hypothetical protein